jgi:hypothetical protein
MSRSPAKQRANRSGGAVDAGLIPSAARTRARERRHLQHLSKRLVALFFVVSLCVCGHSVRAAASWPALACERCCASELETP